MTVFAFENLVGQTVAFTAASDVFVISGIEANLLDFADTTAGVVVSDNTGQSVTLSGTTISQLSTGAVNATAAPNLIISGVTSKVVLGDDSVGTTADDSANTINVSTVAGDHLIYGLGGGDAITANNASTNNVEIFGGSGIVDTVDGSDTIIVGTGNATVYGNAGADSIDFSTGAGNTLTAFGGLGNDTIEAQSTNGGTVEVRGGEGSDTIDLLNGAGGTHIGDFTIFGGNGGVDTADSADFIETGTGGGTVYGNAGNDSVDVRSTVKGTTVFGGLGNDTIRSYENTSSEQEVRGNAGTDTIVYNFGTSGAVTVFGGDDTVDSADGADSITIDGDDAGAGTAYSATVYGNAGNDTISITADGDNDSVAATIFGGLGNDSIITEQGADSVVGGEGNDIITTGAANDTVDGGAGNDSVTVGTGTNSVVGGAGNDTITSGTDVQAAGYFDAGEGDDLIDLDGAANTGANTVIGGLGADTITLDVDNGGSATIWGGSSTNDTADGADSITVLDAVSDEAITIYSTGGDDTITVGMEYLATVFGGQGADSITTSDDADSITGGEGNDVIVAGAGDNTVLGSEGDDSITSGAGNDSIIGGEGNDTISAGAGTNTITGNAGADNITSGAGADTIDGGEGNDTIKGADGADSITGGAGADQFVFENIGGATADANIITDFSTTDGDKVGGFSEADIEGLTLTTDLVSAADATSITAASIAVTTVSAAYDLGTAGTGNVLLISGDYANAAAVETALEVGGDRALTANNAYAAADSFLIAYDNGSNTTLALFNSTAITADDATFAATATVSDLITLNGVSDATTLTASSFLDFVA